jgi:hypothetical protein
LGYKRQRIALGMIVLKPTALETAGNRSTQHCRPRGPVARALHKRLEPRAGIEEAPTALEMSA